MRRLLKKKKKKKKPAYCVFQFDSPSSTTACAVQPSGPVASGIVGLVVKASASRAEDPGFDSRLRRDFSGSSHTSDLKIGTPVATLPGAWRHRVSTRTGWSGVRLL